MWPFYFAIAAYMAAKGVQEAMKEHRDQKLLSSEEFDSKKCLSDRDISLNRLSNYHLEDIEDL